MPEVALRPKARGDLDVYDEVYRGLRVYPSGRHLIFYFVTPDGIDVVRVLHERMDIPSHL